MMGSRFGCPTSPAGGRRVGVVALFTLLPSIPFIGLGAGCPEMGLQQIFAERGWGYCARIWVSLQSIILLY